MRMRQIEKQKKTWENKRKQSVFLGFSFVFFCFSNWPKAQLQFVELTLTNLWAGYGSRAHLCLSVAIQVILFYKCIFHDCRKNYCLFLGKSRKKLYICISFLVVSHLDANLGLIYKIDKKTAKNPKFDSFHAEARIFHAER